MQQSAEWHPMVVQRGGLCESSECWVGDANGLSGIMSGYRESVGDLFRFGVDWRARFGGTGHGILIQMSGAMDE